jgi:GNAT superfamily N-acetyltransferase
MRGDEHRIYTLLHGHPGESLVHWATAVVEGNVGPLYQTAPTMGGWSFERKLAELSDPLLAWLLVLEPASDTRPHSDRAFEFAPNAQNLCVIHGPALPENARIVAFAAFLPNTPEPLPTQYRLAEAFRETEPVLYCLELQVLPGVQSAGIGSRLMRILEDFTRKCGTVRRLVLTCFRANKRACDFYIRRLGYTKDYSSREYLILSKPAAACTNLCIDSSK